MELTYHKIPGWFNYIDSYAQLASNLPDESRIVEIGSFMGRSTSFLATSFWNANKEKVKIYCIDTWEGSGKEHAHLDLSNMYEIFKENLRFFVGREMVIPMQGRSDNQDFLDRFEDGSLDAVCVDGAHTYDEVCDDIKNWWPKLKPDGVMIGDDYNWKSVNQAVNDTFKEMKIDNQIWMNSATEYTWYVAKNGNAEPYKKAIPK